MLTTAMIAVLALTATPHEKSRATANDRPVCELSARTMVDTREPVRIRPLEREPLADQEVAVLRFDDGCIKPVIVREDVGDAAR